MSSENKTVKILAFVGLTGAGKTTVVDYIAAKGHPKVNFNSPILERMQDLGENEATAHQNLLSEKGQDYIVKDIIKQVHDLSDSGQHLIISDGPLSWTEYKTLKHEFPGQVTTVAIVASKHLRHSRSSDNLSQDEIDKRDWFEIENLEKAGPIAIANYYIINDKNQDNLYQQVDKLLQDLNFN